MKAGYTINDTTLLLTMPAIIECCNYKSINEISFYQWHEGIFVGNDFTVAIFKIKPKAITLSND